MTDHRTRILHDEVRERAVSRRTLLRTIFLAGLHGIYNWGWLTHVWLDK